MEGIYPRQLTSRAGDNLIAEIDIQINFLIKLIIALLVIMTISFVLRIVTRLAIARTFRAEDWTMVAAFATAVAGSAMALLGAREELETISGRLSLAETLNMIQTVASILFILALAMTRVSLGFFFLTLFTHKKLYRSLIWFWIITACIFGVALLPLIGVACPVIDLGTKCARAYAQTSTFRNAKFVINVLFAISLITGDLAFVMLSFIALRHVQLPISTRISIGALLALGCVGGVFSAIDMAYTIKIYLVKPGDFTNLALTALTTARWIFIEVALGIIAANLALTRPLFSWISSLVSNESFKTRHTGQSRTLSAGRGNKTQTTMNGMNLDSLTSGQIRKTQVTIVTDEESARRHGNDIESSGEKSSSKPIVYSL